MKSQGEIEAAICEGITRFEQEYMGRGPYHLMHGHHLARCHYRRPFAARDYRDYHFSAKRQTLVTFGRV
jgi:hypothetical protein